MGTLYVLTPLIPAKQLVDALLGVDSGHEVLFGCTILPDDAGVFVRCLGASPHVVRQTLRSLWNTGRQLLLGCPVPDRLGPV